MYPEIFRIGGITIYSYGVMVALGIVLGYILLIKISKYRCISKDFINYLVTGTVIFGIIGARIGYVFISFNQFSDRILSIFMFWQGGLVFWGGFIGGGVWIIYSCIKWNLDILSVGDILAPGVALAHGVGRIGCFLAGCCYGIPTKIGVSFTHPLSLCPDSIPRHPTQLYTSFFLLILSGVLYLKVKKKGNKTGAVFGLYLVLYSIFRILIEFLRGDYRGETLLGFTATQWISVAGLILGFYLFLRKSEQERQYKSRR
ncbi:MAG: prolipoprotein diacylglyceryl transferase [Elusimicrobiota bacterium]